jgi:formamidopyrimidine-DNA glycosylase
MPELPEVEATRLSFASRIEGGRIEHLRLGKPLRWPLGCAPESLAGRVVRSVRRRGKYLLLDLDDGLLLLHLGMSGSLSYLGRQPAPGPHDHFDLATHLGVLRLNDPRRFGALVYTSGEHDPVAVKLLGRLGMEPLGAAFDLDRFCELLKRRNAAIKQVLLAGDVVVGAGNIYACEALFLAGIRPTARASRLSRPRLARLHAALRAVLQKALDHGGSTLRNFSDAAGHVGAFQSEANVYARAGQPCRVCARPVKLLRQGQRSSYYCAMCQKA